MQHCTVRQQQIICPALRHRPDTKTGACLQAAFRQGALQESLCIGTQLCRLMLFRFIAAQHAESMQRDIPIRLIEKLLPGQREIRLRRVAGAPLRHPGCEHPCALRHGLFSCGGRPLAGFCQREQGSGSLLMRLAQTSLLRLMLCYKGLPASPGKC